MAIIPEDKDWTWVLAETCPECGFAAAEATPSTVASTIPTLLPRWQAVLRRSESSVRPDEDTWSPLEYACHVRDVFDIFEARLELMLAQDNPTFENWDQDKTAVESDYGAQDPAVVSHELVDAGEEAASAFASVSEDQWERTGVRSNGSVFTVHTLAGYFLHDVVHHLHDVDG
ncbi:DinB family protein [Arthrobacter sp. 35W]|uniref:DinB family protein n=1 Tax=Arthrobacter sp. 35W TaxID=1132441 RepID=UPI0004235C5A|nr:DinB family protein [Arthrobacter sp. 35W]